MPAEWEPQDAVWLAWPHNAETWPGDALAQVQESFTEAIRHLARGQQVRLLVDDATAENEARRILAYLGVGSTDITFLQIPTRDAWIRDYGPTFVVNPEQGSSAMVSWEFDAWGGKYEEFLPDNQVPELINCHLDIDVFKPGIVLEGGSIDVNGAGLVLTTEQCLLNANRNPQLGRTDLEVILRDYLGVREVVWLGDGIAGDDTDGHVDDVARFVGRDTVVCGREADPRDANYALLEDNYERLVAFRDLAGDPLRVVTLPMPSARYVGAERLPASYANFYIGNGSVLVPLFEGPNDSVALEILAQCFPGRAVVGIDCRALLLGLGTLHCCSQQQPGV